LFWCGFISRSDKVTIVVKKYEPEDFRKIVQFIHSGSVNINSSCIAGLLCGASQFGLDMRIAYMTLWVRWAKYLSI
jgi:hypothetical protein